MRTRVAGRYSRYSSGPARLGARRLDLSHIRAGRTACGHGDHGRANVLDRQAVDRRQSETREQLEHHGHVELEPRHDAVVASVPPEPSKVSRGSPLHHLVTGFPVTVDAADVGQEHASFPGTFAPMYQDLARGKSVMSPQSFTCCTQPASATGVGSIESRRSSRMWTRHALTHSTCCSIETVMLDSTEGLPGPVNGEEVRKARRHHAEVGLRAVGPLVARARPPRLDLDRDERAVIASNPVAKTIASNSSDRDAVSMPVSVDRADGILRRSTKRRAAS